MIFFHYNIGMYTSCIIIYMPLSTYFSTFYRIYAVIVYN